MHASPTVDAYPVQHRPTWEERQSRLTTFFRGVLIIPHYIAYFFVAFAGFFTAIVAWFAVLITGRYPEGLYGFNAGVLRFVQYVAAYQSLQTDRFPPFSLSNVPGYPIQVDIAPPQQHYDRLKVLFRVILSIPVLVVAYAFNLVTQVVAIAAWFVIVITGRLPRGMFDALNLGLSYQAKYLGYSFFVLTDRWPTLTDDPQLTAGPTGDRLASGSGDWAPPTG